MKLASQSHSSPNAQQSALVIVIIVISHVINSSCGWCGGSTFLSRFGNNDSWLRTYRGTIFFPPTCLGKRCSDPRLLQGRGRAPARFAKRSSCPDSVRQPAARTRVCPPQHSAAAQLQKKKKKELHMLLKLPIYIKGREERAYFPTCYWAWEVRTTGGVWSDRGSVKS